MHGGTDKDRAALEREAATGTSREVYPQRRLGRLGAERQGWRARLAHVELLLTEAQDANEVQLRECVRGAIVELRLMIDSAGR